MSTSTVASEYRVPVKQTICCFKAPKGGAEKIEAFVQSKNLKDLNIDWGYYSGRPVLYVMAKERLTPGEFTDLEIKIRAVGIETFLGQLA